MGDGNDGGVVVNDMEQFVLTGRTPHKGPEALSEGQRPVRGGVPPTFGELGTKDPAARIVVFFPVQRQRDLFGADALEIPYRDLFNWRRGIAPFGVRKAVRHEIRRRNLRHVDAAHLLGVSRAHLENLLQGRFGASPPVASRIRDFLIDGAKTVGIAA
jgi:hypothetical protein